MRYYLDTEFIESGHQQPVDLISVGIVAEDGREFYAVSTEFDPRNAVDWVVENVLRDLPPIFVGADAHILRLSCDKRWKPRAINPSDPSVSPADKDKARRWLSRKEIFSEVLEFVGNDPSPEFWGEWCSYDWVVFCQLFGTMMDLPMGWPMRCRDVVQFLEDQLGLSADDWPKSLETPGNHNALLGAKTVKARYEWCENQRYYQDKY